MNEPLPDLWSHWSTKMYKKQLEMSIGECMTCPESSFKAKLWVGLYGTLLSLANNFPDVSLNL